MPSIAFRPARFEHLSQHHAVTLLVHGEIDLADRCDLRGALDEAIAGRPAKVLVDLSDVTFMDSSGMHELARARRRVVAIGGRLVLVSPPPVVHVLIDFWRATDRFEIHLAGRD